MNNKEIKVGLAQMAPVLLNKAATLIKVLDFIDQAAVAECDLVIFAHSP